MDRISQVDRSDNGNLFLMENEKLRVFLTDIGASIFAVQWKLPDGGVEDIALTCDTLADFSKNRAYLGATVGRTVNQIKNAVFTLNGKSYHLSQNSGKHNSHGGKSGFSHRRWGTELTNDQVHFLLHSYDGDEGYPGNLDATVTYRLDNDKIEITYRAISDKDTPFGFTNHTYWCLGGLGKNIYPQRLQVNGSFYLEVDDELVPTGQILSVKDSVKDFTETKLLGDCLQPLPFSIQRTKGYDVSYIRDSREFGCAATLYDTESGRKLEVFTNMPIIHLYTGNYLRDEVGKEGRRYQCHDALCLEASYYPDAINNVHFGRAVLRAYQLQEDKICFKITQESVKNHCL